MEKGFQKLQVWQRAKNLAVLVYQRTDDIKLSKDFGLRDHIRRSAVSIPSNIAEGDERQSDKEAVRFFYIAKGSIAELRTQIRIAFEVNLLGIDIFKNIDKECTELSKMLGAIIKHRGKISSSP